MDAPEHNWPRKPAQHSPRKILQQRTPQQTEAKIPSPRTPTHSHKDKIEKVNQLTESINKFY